MSKQTDRGGRLDRVAQASADFGAAADAVDAAAGAAFQVNRTDLRIIGVLQRYGLLTAGRLATAAGLSPSATTTAIQRLVGAGHLTRTADGTDRRRAVLAVTDCATRLSDRVYGPLATAGRRALARYTDDELAVIEDFLGRGERLQLRHAERIRGLTAG